MVSLMFDSKTILLLIGGYFFIVFALTIFRRKKPLKYTVLTLGIAMLIGYLGIFVHYFATIDGIAAEYSPDNDTYSINDETYYDSGFRVDHYYSSKEPHYAHYNSLISVCYIATYENMDGLKGIIDDNDRLYLNEENLNKLKENIYYTLSYYTRDREENDYITLIITSDQMGEEFYELSMLIDDDSKGVTWNEYCVANDIDNTDDSNATYAKLSISYNGYGLNGDDIDINHFIDHDMDYYYYYRFERNIGNYRSYVYDVNKFTNISAKLDEIFAME